MKKARVLFVSQEIMPYLPETHISRIGRYLPQGIQEKGKEVRAFMPRFGLVNERRNQLHEVIRLSGMNIIINDADHNLLIKVASIQSARLQVYFIDNEDFFGRKQLFTEDDGILFGDNDERAIFFARGVIETIRKLRWAPDIVHCHGWFTGVMPLMLKRTFKDDPLFGSTKIIYSIYNDSFTQNLDSNFRQKLMFEGVTKDDVQIMSDSNYLNFSKLAINHSDAVIIGEATILPQLQSYLGEINKPVLPYQDPANYINTFSEFYDSLLKK